MNRALPKDNADLLHQVQQYLAGADLAECDKDSMAAAIGGPYSTIQYRLRKSGTSWEAEKRAEKTRRLQEIIRRPGKFSAPAAADECGFVEVGSFFRFFTEVMGKTYTEHRASCQQ